MLVFPIARPLRGFEQVFVVSPCLGPENAGIGARETNSIPIAARGNKVTALNIVGPLEISISVYGIPTDRAIDT